MTFKDFTPKLTASASPLPFRKTTDLLPGYLQTDLLKKFFGVTVDQWFQPAQQENISGYIGEKSGTYFKPDTDFYVSGPTNSRNNYQLEPTAVSVDNNNNTNFVQFYQDLIDSLKFDGSLVNNHSRLFSQDYYSWSPPINPDMFVNFSNYYWVQAGPQVRIITQQTNAVLDIVGKKQYTTPGGLELQSGMKIQLINDVNTEYNGVSFIVEGVGTGIILVEDGQFDSSNQYDVPPYDTTPYDAVANAESPNYWTIARGAQDGNPWSTTNRWFHKNILGSLDVENTSFIQAHRPIIEFERNLELRNFARFARPSVRLLSTKDQVLDIVGQSSFVIDGLEVADGDLILITGDNDPSKNNRVYEVFGIEAYGQIGLNLLINGQDRSGAPVTGEGIQISRGITYASQNFYFNGDSWVQGQQKLAHNQPPIFNLYDLSGIRLDDPVEYPNSTFNGSAIFTYVEDSSAEIDQYLGIRVSFATFGDLKFKNLLTDQRFSYNSFGVITEINGYYFFKTYKTALDENLDKFGNDWHKSFVPSRQLVLDSFVIKSDQTSSGLTEFNRLYDISIVPDANINDELFNYRVQLNGKILVEGIDYTLLGRQIELSLTLVLKDYDVLEVQSWAVEIPKLLGDGYFEIPNNLKSNPDNQQITVRSFNEINQQLSSIIANQNNLIGTANGINNYNSTARDLSRGLLILNHTGSLLKTMLLTGNSSTKLTDSIRYSNREYNTFKQKFLIKIQEFNQQGYTSSIPASTWIADALEKINLGKTDVFAFAYSAMTSENNYIPNTPSALGVTPVYLPKMYLDDTRSTPIMVIQGHDGSIINALGDYRDQVILELETEIYNNISSKYSSTQQISQYPVISQKPGYFRKTDYSFDEWNQIAQPGFERWVVKKQIDYVANKNYDSTNPFTWNYSQTKTQDGNFAKGSWRGIYQYMFDTDRPHTHPWEMLGLTQKPSWWDTTYGPAPYTSDNLVMWNDITEGIIKLGTNAGTYSYLKRPGLLSMLPVDSQGNLLDPVAAGIVLSAPDVVSAQSNWKFGDIGPGEYNWKISSSYPFDLAETMFLAKPALFTETFWQRNKFAESFDQVYDIDFGTRLTNSNIVVHNEILDDGNRQIVKGISAWISDYLASVSLNIKENFGDLVRDLNVKLAYKTGAFIKSQNLRVVSDSFGVVPNENLTVKLYKSASISQPIYSAIIILWDGSNYRVVGYDNIDETFKYLPGQPSGPRSSITVDNITIDRYDTVSTKVAELPYYASLPNREAVYNFMIGYQRYLESQGWIFDDYDSITNQPKNFDTAARQFLRWSQVPLKVGQSIIFSPASDHLVLSVDHGHIDNVQGFVNGVYGILDRTGFGITDDKIQVDRLDNRFELSVKDNSIQGVYCLRLSLVEFEHILLIDNITKFNDLVYDPVLGIRQPRFRVFENRTKFWNGKPQALGFIIQEDDLIDNFEYSVDNLRRFFDFDWQPATGVQADLAMHTIGFQERDYTIDLMLDKSSEFDFYRGFIRNKGTKSSFDNILRSSYITKTAGFDILEEWAFNIGTYGNTERKSSIELKIDQSEFVTNPQIVDFVSNVGTNPTIIDVTPTSDKWVLKRQNNLTNNQFTNRGFKNAYRQDLPNAGFVQLNETTYTITNHTDLESLFNTVVYDNSKTFLDGDTIWTIITENGDWSVQRVCIDAEIASITQGAQVGDPTIITTVGNHSVAVGETIMLQNSTSTSQNLQGLQKVLSVPSANSFTIEPTVDVAKIFTSFDFVADFTLPDNQFTSIVRGGIVDGLSIQLSSTGDLPDGLQSTTTYFIVNSNENSFDLSTSSGGTPVVITDNGTGTLTATLTTPEISQNVYTLKSVRFKTISDRNSFTPHAGWKDFDRAFIDNNGSGRWTVMSYDFSLLAWNTVRTENDKIDIDQIYNVYVYDNVTNIDSIELELYDPFKGLIVSSADRELYYKLNYDPAKYNTGDETIYQIDIDQAWGSQQVGRLWWNLSTTRFLDYEQGTLDYRRKNWGKLAPGISVDIYEWTKSPVLPSTWDSYVLSASNTGTNRPSGTAIYGSDTPYVVAQEYNSAKNILENVYYFWVKLPNTVPDGLNFRKFSALEVSQLIQNTNNQSIALFAPISNNAFILTNTETFINDTSSVLQITFYEKQDDSTIHKQWILQRENDSVNLPYSGLWNKMRDSLVGFDETGLSVPDTSLSKVEILGNSIRPRQTWFQDRLQARLEFFEKINKTLLSINTTNIVGWADNLFVVDPLPQSSEYDYQVSTRADRDLLDNTIVVGKKVLVVHDELLNSYWSLWQYAGGSSWTLLNQQLYRTSDYWSRIDWYADGFDASTRIYFTWADIPTMNANSALYADGFVIKVLNDGAGTWSLYQYNKVLGVDQYTLIAQQQGTIKFLTSLYNYDILNSSLDKTISTATKQIIYALKTNILSVLEQNQLFFTMVQYVHKEQNVVPWAFKTSLVVGQGDELTLEQQYISNQNLTDSLVQYFDEAKPYHVKLRALTEQRKLPKELVELSVTDERFMQIALLFDRVTQYSSIPEGANYKDYDLSKLSTADRIQLFYKPTEGMPPKVLANLISRSEYAGTVVDGIPFYQFGANLAAGYSNQPLDDDILGGYDFDQADLENLYDAYVNGSVVAPAPIDAIQVINGGQGYAVNDAIAVAGSGSGATGHVNAIHHIAIGTVANPALSFVTATGSVANPVFTPFDKITQTGDVIVINGVRVEITGTSLAQAIADINSHPEFSQNFVIDPFEIPSSPFDKPGLWATNIDNKLVIQDSINKTITISGSAATVAGLNSSYHNMQAISINGVAVAFTKSGLTGIISDINNAAIPNIIATHDSTGHLVIKSSATSPITISDIAGSPHLALGFPSENYVSSTGSIASVTITNPGADYSSVSPVTVTSVFGSGARLVAKTTTFANVPQTVATINLDGNQFVQPLIDDDHPEELSKIRAGDSLIIDVYTNDQGFNSNFAETSSSDFALDASDRPLTAIKYPKFRVKRFIGTSTPRSTFGIGQLPQSKNSLFAYVDGVLLKDGTDYSVNWNTTEITLVSALTLGHTLVINSFGSGGGKIIKKKSWKNSSGTVFNMSTPLTNVNDVYVMIDGKILVPGIDFTVSNTSVTIINNLPNNSTVLIVVFDSNDYSQIETEFTPVVDASGNKQVTVSRPAFSTQPAYISTHVFHNGLRLSPPSMKLYTENTSDNVYKTTVVPSAPNKVRVWRNGIEQSSGVGFNRFFVNGVLIISGGSGYAVGDTVAISGTGTGATAQVGVVDSNGAILGITMITNGTDYTGTPLATVTSGIGSGAVLLVQVSQDEIESLVPATGVVKILVVVEENGDYTISGNNSEIINLPGFAVGDIIEVTTYSDDVTYGMQSETFAGNVVSSYALGGKPYNTNSIFVYVNGLLKIFGVDFSLVDDVLGYDSEVNSGYGDVYDSLTNLSVVFAQGSHSPTDKIVITYFSGLPAEDSVGFKLFKNIFGTFEYLRISDASSTTTTAPLLITDKQITVDDATKLGQPDAASQTPGVVFINGERITFWTVDTSIANAHVLGQCMRATAGTAINDDLPTGVVVRDASKNQQIPGGWNWEYTPDGVLYSQSQQAKFLRQSPGSPYFGE